MTHRPPRRAASQRTAAAGSQGEPRAAGPPLQNTRAQPPTHTSRGDERAGAECAVIFNGCYLLRSCREAAFGSHQQLPLHAAAALAAGHTTTARWRTPAQVEPQPTKRNFCKCLLLAAQSKGISFVPECAGLPSLRAQPSPCACSLSLPRHGTHLSAPVRQLCSQACGSKPTHTHVLSRWGAKSEVLGEQKFKY